MGDTARDEVWSQLRHVIAETWPTEDGSEMPLKLMAIDSGYLSQTVYNFVRQYPQTKVIATKGFDHLPTIFGSPRATDVTVAAKTIRRGLKVWPIGVSILKTELYSWLRLDKPIAGEGIPAGFCFFPEYDDNYFKGLTAEQIVYVQRRGYNVAQWVKIRDQNEPLDCRIYARAAAALCGLDRMKPTDFPEFEKEKNEAIEKIPETDHNKNSQQKNKKTKKRIRENWF
jgi:phage terminase large subunit GpA-like protein